MMEHPVAPSPRQPIAPSRSRWLAAGTNQDIGQLLRPSHRDRVLSTGEKVPHPECQEGAGSIVKYDAGGNILAGFPYPADTVSHDCVVVDSLLNLVCGGAVTKCGGSLHQYDPTFSRQWRVRESVTLSLSVDLTDNVYAAGSDTVAKYNKDGDLLWQVSLGGEMNNVITQSGFVWATDKPGVIYKLDASDGSQIWKVVLPVMVANPAHNLTVPHQYQTDCRSVDSNDNLYLGTLHQQIANPTGPRITGEIHKFDTDGNLVARWEEPHLEASSLNVNDLSVESGKLFASVNAYTTIGSKIAPFTRRHDLSLSATSIEWEHRDERLFNPTSAGISIEALTTNASYVYTVGLLDGDDTDPNWASNQSSSPFVYIQRTLDGYFVRQVPANKVGPVSAKSRDAIADASDNLYSLEP